MSYKHFTLEEREYLQLLLEKGYGVRQAARALKRDPSSVSREISRNKSSKGYNHWHAHCLSIERKRKSHPMTRLAENSEFGAYAREKLNLFWPPECIAEMWARSHPNDRVGFTTIYRWLKKGKLEGFSRKTHLRRRGKKIQTRQAKYNTIHPDRLISDWPEETKKRVRLGDWEGDTVYGGIGKGFIVTLVDRKSRFLCSALVKSRSPKETKESIIRALKGKKVLSLSLDNGSEFSLFRELEKELKAPIYFAKPHAPWQRGSNENMNGLLRFFFPKGCDFLSITEEELQTVVDLVNNRPRKCLGWKTPTQISPSQDVALT